jgi:hypothetical protein
MSDLIFVKHSEIKLSFIRGHLAYELSNYI